MAERRHRRWAWLLAAGLQAGLAAPVDAQLEQRVTRLAEELRCLVCQNQSLADSHAALALDLKNQVREQLALGRSEEAVRDYLVQRYGDFVLYRPPLKRSTWLLWFGPLLLTVAGLTLLGLRWRREQRAAAPDAAGPDQAPT